MEDGQHVYPGAALTEGDKNPADILRINGIDAVYDYILLEVQKVYRSQGININDKHIEVIARQMTRKIEIEEEGDTGMLSGSTVNLSEYLAANEEIAARKAAGEIELCEAVGKPVLLGITKAALLTESFLSAASFQETTKVLTEAAIKGKIDHLLALKENVLIGRLIPAGTGMDCYRNIGVERTSPMESPLYGMDLSEFDLEEAGKTIRMEDEDDASDGYEDIHDDELMENESEGFEDDAIDESFEDDVFDEDETDDEDFE